MPSNIEIKNLKDKYPDMRIWGTSPSAIQEESRLGDIAVIPFDDVVAALGACKDRILHQVIEAISEYHQKAQGFEEYCFDCYEDWPCPTVKAIEDLRSKGSAENTNETL